jgi:glutamyl endopeptidase
LNGWVNSRDTRYDAGIIKLNCTVGSTVGWFGMWWQSASLNGLSTTVQGYPGDKPSTQWRSRDFVRATETEKIYYQNDTVGGQSGSPVYQNRASGSSFCVGVCAMAIHTNGVGGSGFSASNNSGNRITQAKYNTFVSIINTP